ncbi:MAG: DUF3089 domain-containing protein, partial [Chitinophagaceae bacterium]
SIDDDYLNAKTDYTSILFQASVFNRQCRVFAPRYRQAHIVNFFSKDKESASKAFDRAYNDLKTAFEYYLKTWNHERPIIIASHSQGSLLAERLLKEFFENKPLLSKLVVVYVLGWPVLNDYFSNLKMCEDSLETGCLCSWRTFRKGYIPSYMRANKNIVAGGNAFFNNHSFVTNPLNWKTTSEYASKKMNKGSVLTKFNNIYFHTTDAQIGNGLLYVKKPKFPWSFLYFRKNYHIADINLFYLNIRENLQQRIVSYLKKNQ